MHAQQEEDDDVAKAKSSYRTPDPKAQLSARVRGSILEKLDAIVRIWQAQAQADGKPDAAVEAIDRTHVVDSLLATAVDEELALHGGLPSTDEQWKTLLSGIKRAAH